MLFTVLKFGKWLLCFRIHACKRMLICEKWAAWFDCKMRSRVVRKEGTVPSLLAEGVKQTHAGDAWGGVWQTAGLLATAHVQERWEMNSLFKVIYLTYTDVMISSLKGDNSNSKEGFPCLNSDHSQVLNSWPNLTPILWTAIVKFESKTKDTPRLSDIVTLNVLDPCVVML